MSMEMEMEASGLYMVVYGERYFIYTSRDRRGRNPQNLGRQILYKIPSDRDQYNAWLSRQREFYARVTESFEKWQLCFTYNEAFCKPKRRHERIEDAGLSGPTSSVCEWRVMPVHLFDSDNHGVFQYTYTVDLDKELFRVNDSIAFHLWNIPRFHWIKEEWHDELDFVATFYQEPYREAQASSTQSTCFENDAERDTYLKHYREYQVTTVNFTEITRKWQKRCPGQILALAVFDAFTDRRESKIWDFLPQYDHRSFVFRELAFALLSFAAGKFRFQAVRRLLSSQRKWWDEGLRFNTKSPQERGAFFATLGSGCHLPDEKPGSAPSDTMFWLDDVAVSLVPDGALQEDTEAAVAQLVTYGLKSDKKAFSAILFSIHHAVMLDIDTRKGKTEIRLVQKLPILLPVQYPWTPKIQDSDFGVDSSNADLMMIHQAHVGFVALQNFFSVRAWERLPDVRQDVFPTEVWHLILSFASFDTRQAFAQVSRQFYELCQACHFFDDQYTITAFNPGQTRRCSDRERAWDDYRISELGSFTFSSNKTGEDSYSTVQTPWKPASRWSSVRSWYPVVGTLERQTIVTNARLQLQFKCT